MSKSRINQAAIEKLRTSPEVSNMLYRAAQRGASAAQSLAPVDTGRLKNSISAEAGLGSARYGSNVDYARYVEFGTQHQEAQPFLRPSIDMIGDGD